MRKIIQCLQLTNETVTPEETVVAIKRAGFDGVFIQWYDELSLTRKEDLIALCRGLDLDIPFAHLGYKAINDIWIDGKAGDELVDGYIADLEDLSRLGVREALVHLSSTKTPPSPNALGLKRLERIFSRAEELEMRVLTENNSVRRHLDFVYDGIDRRNVGLCLDVGHCHAHFGDELDWEKFRGRVFELHLHDNDGSGDQHLLPFDGSVPWEYYAKKLKECEFDGVITLESRYCGKYLGTSIDEFYADAYCRAVRLRDLFDE